MTPYLNEIKIGLAITLIVGVLWYWHDLTSTIQSQKTDIAILQGKINTQNQSIIDAGIARDKLQADLDARAEKNKKLEAENKKLKGDIANRPDAKSCEEAMNYISITAQKVSQEFNSR